MDKHIGTPRRQQLTRFRAVIKRQLLQLKGSVALAAVCMIGSIAADLLSPWPLKIIVDHVLLDKPLPAQLAPLGGLIEGEKLTAVVVVASSILLIAALSGVFDYVQLVLTSRIGYQVVHTLRRELFSHLQRLSLTYHNRARSGDLLTKVAGDTAALKDAFADSALAFVAQVLTIIGMIGIMLWLNRPLSLVVLLTLPLLGSTLFIVYRKIRVSARRQRKKEGEIAARISEILGSIVLVQAFGRERYERERFETESAQTLNDSLRTARMEAAATRTTGIVSAFGVWAVVLFGAYQVLAGRLLLGELLIFISYANSIYKPIRNLAKLSGRFSKAAVSAERIGEILEIEPEIQDTPGAISAANIRGTIAFSRVSFDYGDGTPILRDLSFTIPAGHKVALVGASGAGKSTITSLILRFYDPGSGTISIDGIDLRAFRRESLRRQIGIMLQDSILFGASIGENIAYGAPDATPDEIEEAARQAHAHDFISALPDGYDTILGEGGSTISGGQRQRICLARAIIKRPALLILDEPTSAVDAESSALIQAAIERVQHGKTTLVIAHNFGFIQHFDHILVMHSGRIVEQGRHAELLARRGYYYDLFRLQQADSQTMVAGASTPVPLALPGPAADNSVQLGGAGDLPLSNEPALQPATTTAAARPATPAQLDAGQPANRLFRFRSGLLLLVLLSSALLGFGLARQFAPRSTSRTAFTFSAGAAAPAPATREQLPATAPPLRAPAGVSPAPSSTAVSPLPSATAAVVVPVASATSPLATTAAPPTATPTRAAKNAASIALPTAPHATPALAPPAPPATSGPAAPSESAAPRPTVAPQPTAPPMPTEAAVPTMLSQPTAPPVPTAVPEPAAPPIPTAVPEPAPPEPTSAPPSTPVPSDVAPEPSDDHDDGDNSGNSGDDDNSGHSNGDDDNSEHGTHDDDDSGHGGGDDDDNSGSGKQDDD